MVTQERSAAHCCPLSLGIATVSGSDPTPSNDKKCTLGGNCEVSLRNGLPTSRTKSLCLKERVKDIIEHKSTMVKGNYIFVFWKVLLHIFTRSKMHLPITCLDGECIHWPSIAQE